MPGQSGIPVAMGRRALVPAVRVIAADSPVNGVRVRPTISLGRRGDPSLSGLAVSGLERGGGGGGAKDGREGGRQAGRQAGGEGQGLIESPNRADALRDSTVRQNARLRDSAIRLFGNS